MEQKITSSTTKGLIIGLILIVLGLIIYFLKIDVNGPVRWLQLLIFVAGIIWSVMSYGKQLNYHSTFGNYFAHGFKVTAVATVILIIYIIIFNIVFPDFKENAIDQSRKGMTEKGMTSEQIDQAITITKKFFMVFVVGGLLIVNMLAGAISSLIGAAVTKKVPVQLGEDINQIGQ
jgi:Protein of unknown function (DUF4199)